MSIFDTNLIYIVSMKCGKDIDFDVTKRAVFSLVIPFMLFVIGMFFGAFYDSMFIWILSLFPFYFYTFVFVNLSRLTEVRNGVMGSTYLAFLSLIVLVVLFVVGFWPDSEWFTFLGREAFLNTPFVIAFTLVGTICETFDFRIRNLIEQDDI